MNFTQDADTHHLGVVWDVRWPGQGGGSFLPRASL